MQSAFWREVLVASQDHGSDGYTGTIAEKYEYIPFTFERSCSALDVARLALDFDSLDQERCLVEMPEELNEIVPKIAEAIRDKWGPAGAIELVPDEMAEHVPLDGDKLYLFFGWAPY